jgi:hypothetical protein
MFVLVAQVSILTRQQQENHIVHIHEACCSIELEIHTYGTQIFYEGQYACS